MNDIAEALWLFLPAGLANAAPVIANKIPILNRWQASLDFGRSYKGRRVFGPNKTWRGVTFAVLVAALAGLLQAQFAYHPFDSGTAVWVAALMGFGAIYGDAIESFLKRQYGAAAGQPWFPFDQIDYIIGGLLAAAPLALFSWPQMTAILAVYFGLHLATAYLGFRLKLKDGPI